VQLIRCAWHPRYHGYPRLLGVASWRGLSVHFTDGICPTCATRVTPDRTRTVPPSQRPRWPGAGRAAVLFVGVPLTAALVLAATPLSELPVPSPPAVAALPSAAAAPDATHARDAEPRVSRVALERDCDEVVRRVLARRSNAPRPVVVHARPVVAAPAPRIVPASRLVTVAHVVGRPLAPPSVVTVARGVERVEVQSP
jgi:hypothetical protein